jgi:HEPN domain-containing protein
MTAESLGRSYFVKATKRLKILDLLLEEEDYSDVVRKAQEIVELSLKGVLRITGVEPPKLHDVGHLLLEYSERLPPEVAQNADSIAAISKWLRKEREFSFYGDIDLIPTEEYSRENGLRALGDARFVVEQARIVFESGGS